MKLVASALLVVYVAAVIEHVSPPGAPTARIRPVTDVFINPLFRQEWGLFAPKISTLNLVSYVELRDSAGEEERFEVTSRLDAVSRSIRWSPPRLRRIDTYVAMTLHNQQIYLRQLEEKREAGRTSPRLQRVEKTLKYREELMASLTPRYVSALARSVSQEEPTSVRLVIYAVEIPPRDSADDRPRRALRVVETPWTEYVQGLDAA